MHAGSSKLLAGTCVVSTKLLEELQKRSLEAARVAAEAAIKARKASSNQASTSAATSAQDQQGVQSSPFRLS